MAFSVRFTAGAKKDLRAIHSFIADSESLEKADSVAAGIVQAALKLQDHPNRGAYPAELLKHGIRTFRQIFFMPYRVIYRVRAKTVFIALIADGRRDLASLLARRLPGR